MPRMSLPPRTQPQRCRREDREQGADTDATDVDATGMQLQRCRRGEAGDG